MMMGTGLSRSTVALSFILTKKKAMDAFPEVNSAHILIVETGLDLINKNRDLLKPSCGFVLHVVQLHVLIMQPTF